MSDPVGERAVTRTEVIARYYDACNSGDLDGLTGTLHPNVVHYFLAPNVGSAPVGPRDRLIGYWRKVQPRIDGVWVVDHSLESDLADEAVIEWSLFWTPEGGGRVVTRGAEWFAFRGGLIVEIRSYYQQHSHDTELESFGYRERGYSVHESERSRIHDAQTNHVHQERS